MREALKAGQKVRLAALRLLSASVKNREVELRHGLSEGEFIEVVAREVKKRKEAVEAYGVAGRDDRAAQEREEQKVLEAYLPVALTDGEIDALVDEGLQATGATRPQEMGKVMAYVMGRAKGRADGRAVQAKVRDRLSS